jgi:hypothetical protein
MNELTPTGLLEEARTKFSNFRSSVVEAMAVLYDVHMGEAWKNVADSWGEYVESELQISQSFASKLLTTYKHYCIDANLSQEKIAGIDYEKLYLAAKTEGTPEEQVAKARTLTRRELKEEKNDEAPHEHIPVSICKTCSIRL